MIEKEMPQQEQPPVVPPLPSPARADVRTFGDSLYAQVDTVLAELGIWPDLVVKKRRDLANQRDLADAIGQTGATDLSVDTISIRVPADLPLPVVNLSLTRLAQWHGGSVFLAAERGRRTVEVVCGTDSVKTTLFVLRRDDRLQRRAGRIAIVLDDFGGASSDQQLVQRFFSLPQPLTLTVLPNEGAKAAQTIELAKQRGHEVLLHLPMEPNGYPEKDPGEEAILVRQDDETIRRLVNDNLRRVPSAVGVNNHMGSRATADSRVMAAILRALKQRDLFFLDSRTTPETLGLAMASALQVPAASRDLFIDADDAAAAKVEGNLWKLAALAARQGYAIGIGHGREQTLLALESILPRLESRGHSFVPVSQIVQ